MRYPVNLRRARATIALSLSSAALACDANRNGGDATPAANLDPRTPVALPADAQQAVLREMRQMLAAIGGVLSAAAGEDASAVLDALRPAGSAAAADPAIEALLPAAWKELAERTHGGFDSLAASVRAARTPLALRDTVLVGVARITGSCTACHETFRVTVQ